MMPVLSGLSGGFRGMKGGKIGKSALVVGAGASFIVWLCRWRKSSQMRKKAIAKREKEQAYIAAQLESLSREVDLELMEQILALSATELLDRLRNGDLNPVDVLKIYLYKACKVTGSLNCVTEIVRSCHEKAENLSEDNRKDQLLYGLPVSLKEGFFVKGTTNTIGLVRYIDNIAKEDSALAKVLRHAGAIPFVKTNLPQTMFSYESSNPIYGETSNPVNPKFGPGGSSSGEGAIIGAGASLLGFGSDIAGSIRVPAHFSGICGLKLTSNRISLDGVQSGLPGQTAVKPMSGPMARDVDTLVLAMRALLCDLMFELDPSVPPIHFRDKIYSSKKPLRIGYYDDDGYMEPVPACKRAVRITKVALESAGHTLVPFKVPDMEKLMNMASKAFYADGGKTNLDALRDDVVDKRMVYTWRRWFMPPLFRRIYAKLLSFKSRRIANDLLAYGGGDKSALRLWTLTAEMQAYQAKFWKEWKEMYKIDALICPVYPMVACPKGMLTNMTAWMSYSSPYTVVNCPAGTVTITKVTEKDISDLENHQGHYHDQWDRYMKKASKDSINMPVGVQCVAPPWQEELCLRLMKEVETLLVK